MSDLIDRESAVKIIDEIDPFDSGWRAYAIVQLHLLDTIDVVRCTDCKHLFDGEHNANCCEVLMEKAKWLIEITVDENWYCGDGERRTDGESV